MVDHMLVTNKRIFTQAMDPIYIGTGGYNIGRVDNTIVRDPITKIPKIPGSSIAGTWRYYSALELVSRVKDYQPSFKDIKSVNGENFSSKLKNVKWKDDFPFGEQDWESYPGNKVARIKCAGQDDLPNKSIDDIEEETGHCGHCIVCKSFGFSKKDISMQGLLFFSDLKILFYPVFTMLGTKWITSEKLLKEAGILDESRGNNVNELVCYAVTDEGDKEGHINLGWLYFPYKKVGTNIDLSLLEGAISLSDIVIVPDYLISQIINSNLEVRTSVSINPITGAAKEGALFTSEAIPRGTIFYGEIRFFDRSKLNEDLPSKEFVFKMLEDSKKYYETLGVGGMTTRGFGRMKVLTKLNKSNGGDSNEKS
ncbi:CRISPR-associated protein Cmr4 [Thermosipho japonicus]|uniref:CRISPR-associated protein Cmr4 n=1 Tax=Thermosipho japonicus TaxID=90323 RepID=A0A841GV55_9BACT|nr:RAMP superfamily CRISPR-associated protein [Thermosipho japonicus]MBB6062781.1 CRISPR-associated protein Cmr4 [Thermosipho japonicus]